jgi:hypothetical protein
VWFPGCTKQRGKKYMDPEAVAMGSSVAWQLSPPVTLGQSEILSNLGV